VYLIFQGLLLKRTIFIHQRLFGKLRSSWCKTKFLSPN
jgi:hypothetical protein